MGVTSPPQTRGGWGAAAWTLSSPALGGRRSPPLPLTSLSDPFLALPHCLPRIPGHMPISFLPHRGRLPAPGASVPGPFLPPFSSSKYVAVCSQMAQTEEATHPQPFRSASLPHPLHNPIQVFDSKCRFSKKHFTDEGWGPWDECVHPHPCLQTWPPFQASWIPHPAHPEKLTEWSHRGIPCPQFPFSSPLPLSLRPTPLPGWPCPCHERLAGWRTLRQVAVGQLGMPLFLTGKDRPQATSIDQLHCPCLPHTHLSPYPSQRSLGDYL